MAAAPRAGQRGRSDGCLTLPAYDAVRPLWTFAELRTLAAILLALVSLVVRYRRGAELAARRQLLWLVLAVTWSIPVFMGLGPGEPAAVVVLFAFPLIPLAITVASCAHRPARHPAGAVAGARLAAAVAGRRGGTRRWSPCSTAVSVPLGRSALATAVLVRWSRSAAAAPAAAGRPGDLRRPLGPGAGGRPELGERLARRRRRTAWPRGLDPTGACGCPYVALCRRRGGAGRRAARRPDRAADRWPPTYGGEAVGELEVGLRAGERRLAAADRGCSACWRPPLAVALHATDLRPS